MSISVQSQTFSLNDSTVKVNDILVKNILFDYNATRILPESFPFLDSLSSFIKVHPKVLFEIGHHTDQRGSATYNMKLSEYRAKMVKTYLVKKGCDQSKIVIKGYGETKPVINLDTIEAMKTSEEKEIAFKLNRRTEFKILKIIE